MRIIHSVLLELYILYFLQCKHEPVWTLHHEVDVLLFEQLSANLVSKSFEKYNESEFHLHESQMLSRTVSCTCNNKQTLEL